MLETVTVEGRAYDRALWDAGFYKRERRGHGRFIDADQFARLGGSGSGTLLRETPRVIVERGKGNGEYAYSLSGAGRCRMNVFIDGAFAREAMPSRGDLGVPLSEIISRTGIHAIEIYPSVNSVPIEFTR